MLQHDKEYPLNAIAPEPQGAIPSHVCFFFLFNSPTFISMLHLLPLLLPLSLPRPRVAATHHIIHPVKY